MVRIYFCGYFFFRGDFWTVAMVFCLQHTWGSTPSISMPHFGTTVGNTKRKLIANKKMEAQNEGPLPLSLRGLFSPVRVDTFLSFLRNQSASSAKKWRTNAFAAKCDPIRRQLATDTAVQSSHTRRVQCSGLFAFVGQIQQKLVPELLGRVVCRHRVVQPAS